MRARQSQKVKIQLDSVASLDLNQPKLESDECGVNHFLNKVWSVILISVNYRFANTIFFGTTADV